MAAGVRTATNLGLQIVAQVHTHPGTAYHSDGDVEGTRIRYTGYSSIVLPDYGRHLPSLTGAAVYVFTSDGQWDELEPRQVIVIWGMHLTKPATTCCMPEHARLPQKSGGVRGEVSVGRSLS
jgi:hypothetical protein